MHKFNSGGVEIAYQMAGEGPPILLIHGFASNARVNWWDTSWVRTLTEAGRRVISFDHRGHGASEKLYDSALYPAAEMAEDARRLLDHLGIAQADVMGYSMGARVSAFLAIAHPDRVRRAVFAGLASRMITGVGGAEAIALALEAPSRNDVSDIAAKAFRIFAEQTKSDLKALAACIRSSRERITVAELATIRVPVLVVAGEKDEVAGDVETLVKAIPGARGVTLPNRNHMNAVGDRGYKDAVLAFLG
ncbi:alpha/beta hydrolase [Aestuariivirga litoralis]|uniref:Alpha/beta hydrolase n=1 Tax=Aestuariivirga litoralis TaxID=2650924 RepID=A0A2W2BMK4_9HYPH|nr:alpha/beta hydrolase [Aestuariivirga litoralis]PZF77087.1 alpha/beta hydrolase [Aestuariivirga litoralis]